MFCDWWGTVVSWISLVLLLHHCFMALTLRMLLVRSQQSHTHSHSDQLLNVPGQKKLVHETLKSWDWDETIEDTGRDETRRSSQTQETETIEDTGRDETFIPNSRPRHLKTRSRRDVHPKLKRPRHLKTQVETRRSSQTQETETIEDTGRDETLLEKWRDETETYENHVSRSRHSSRDHIPGM